MASNCYGAGKSSKGPTYSSGKSPNMTGSKPTASSGSSSGTNRKGDPGGAPAQGQGKK